MLGLGFFTYTGLAQQEDGYQQMIDLVNQIFESNKHLLDPDDPLLQLEGQLLDFDLEQLSAIADQLTGVTNQLVETAMLFRPEQPEPGEEVTVSLDIYTNNLVGATIVWFKDGVVMPDKANEIKITLEAPPLNRPVSLRAEVRLANGRLITLNRKLTSGYTDIVIEALTYTPSFYQGQPLGSAGSPIKATAILSTTENPKNLVYTWELNNEVLFGGPAYGRQTIDLVMPNSGKFLAVDINNRAGDLVGSRIIEIAPESVEVNFYENNPLRGQSKLALPREYILVGNEVTVRAEPYYTSLQDTDAVEEWRLDGVEVNQSGVSGLRDIVLTAGEDKGRSRFSYSFYNSNHLLQRGKKEITVLFNQAL